jgi:hypothetical protein
MFKEANVLERERERERERASLVYKFKGREGIGRHGSTMADRRGAKNQER